MSTGLSFVFRHRDVSENLIHRLSRSIPFGLDPAPRSRKSASHGHVRFALPMRFDGSFPLESSWPRREHLPESQPPEFDLDDQASAATPATPRRGDSLTTSLEFAFVGPQGKHRSPDQLS